METLTPSESLPRATPLSGATFNERLADFFRLYDPEKQSSIVGIVAKYGGDEETLTSYLEDKYGVPGFFRSQHLHFSSGFFDAPRALYDGHLVPPYPDARPLDNVHKAQILLPSPAGTRLVQIGVLHGSAHSQADAAWWRGDAPTTALNWLADAMPQGPMAWLKPLVAARAQVRVMTRHCDPDGSPVLACWRGWLKGADSDGNVLLVGATRAVHARIEEHEESIGGGIGATEADSRGHMPVEGFQQAVGASAGPSLPAESDPNRATVLLIGAHAVLSIAAEKSRQWPISKDIEAHLRR